MVERAGVRDRLDSIRRVLAEVGATPADVAAIGITTHRETAFAWDRRTGTPVQNAIMWMSKQTDSIVRRWSAAELDPEVRARTGLNNDSYFTAPKLAWFLERVFEPEMDDMMRAALYRGWCDAVRHVRAAPSHTGRNRHTCWSGCAYPPCCAPGCSG
jgi:glycerol kinase